MAAEIEMTNPDTIAKPGGHYSHAVAAHGCAYVTDIASWPAFNSIYVAWPGAARPVRAVVPAPELHFGFKTEVEAVALANFK
jgi:hypothetical protein